MNNPKPLPITPFSKRTYALVIQPKDQTIEPKETLRLRNEALRVNLVADPAGVAWASLAQLQMFGTGFSIDRETFMRKFNFWLVWKD